MIRSEDKVGDTSEVIIVFIRLENNIS